MRVTIIGLGLIGGSMALNLRKRGFASHFVGVERNETHAQKALEMGLVDEILPLEEAIIDADYILLSIPVKAAIAVAPRILDAILEHQVLIDLCSTKHNIELAVEEHPKRGRFVNGHTMSGTEFSGPTAAKDELFTHKIAIICNKERSDTDALEMTEELFRTLDMRLDYMDSSAHDVHAAYVSHISHISSFSLALSVLEQEADHVLDVQRMAAGGFLSTVRLAKSSPETWESVLEDNARNMMPIIDNYIGQLMKFKEALSSGNTQELKGLMQQANQIKGVIENLESPKKERV